MFLQDFKQNSNKWVFYALKVQYSSWTLCNNRFSVFWIHTMTFYHLKSLPHDNNMCKVNIKLE